jgi:4-hydroxybenzoate polyprenyltransferase
MEKYSNKKSELRYVLPLIGGTLAAIILFHILYWPEFTALENDPFFLVVYIILLLAYSYGSYLIYKKRDESEPNGKRWAVLIIAAILCSWIGGWCSQYRMDKSDNIEYEYKKP